MAKKDSYWRKYKEKANSPLQEDMQRPPLVKANESVKALYEEGKVLLLDKPLHWTSFDMVRKIRNSIGIKKVGHAGTLDPLATGLLIICTGKFTKKINEYMSQEKEYTGSFTLGAVTATYDLESEPGQQKDYSAITPELLHTTAARLTGEIMQFPPVYSAIKKKGTPLYELARRGEEVDLQARPVVIREFEITSVELPVVNFRITCSTGTYIRSVANDFGAALGCGAYLSALRRTKIGDFKVDDAITIEAFLEEITKGTGHQNG